MHFREYKHDQVVILQLRGYYIGDDETRELEQRLNELFDEGNRQLVFDLGEVMLINASALGVLLTAHAKYRRANRRIHLARVEGRIKNIFTLTKLQLTFDAFPSVDDAVNEFAKYPVQR